MVQTILCFVGAAIVALVVILIIRRMNYDYGPHWAVVLLILLVSGNAAWAGDWYLRRLETDRMTKHVLQKMEDDLVLQAVKDADPETYGKVVKIVEDTSVFPSEERPDKAEALINPVLNNLMKRKAARLNDEMLVKTAVIVRDRMAERMKTNPQACDKEPTSKIMLMETARGDSAMKDQMKQHFIDVIRSEPAPVSARSATPEQINMMLISTTTSWLMHSGLTAEQIRGKNIPAGMKCQMFVSMFDQILALPQDEAGALMRGMTAAATRHFEQ